MIQRLTIAEQHRGRCRHFTGIQHDRCEAGISYASVRDETVRPFGYPCFAKDGIADRCSRADFPTAEEADAHEIRVKQRLADMFKARQAVVEDTGGKRRVTGSIGCPVCGAGTLRYSVAGNGHIWGACSIKDCVSWME